MPLAVERSYPTPVANSALLPLLLLSLAKQRHTPAGSTKIGKEYDYVIVGGGSAGSVMASRLSEEPCVSVLLLEAGHKPPLLTEVPAFSRSFWFTDVDWQYRTTPQKNTARCHVDRQVVWPSGKMLGGSSNLNGMLYVRGNKRNYDQWEKQGANGWGYKDVYPYFLKMEDNKDFKFLANGYHASGGPVTVQQPGYESEIKWPLSEAVSDLGYEVIDVNDGRQTGFYDPQATLRSNQRCGTAKAYLVPAENRTNLDILPNAKVTKVIIRRGRARGVQFEFQGRRYEVRARREVIVSAGTVNSAQLLMLSGVGPRKDLQRMGIPVKADLPVGQNLQDHGTVFIPYVLSPRIPEFGEKLSDPQNIEQYIRNRTGPLASTAGISYMAFLKDQDIRPRTDFPNYQLYFGEITAATIRDTFGLKPEVYRKVYGPYEDEPLMICMVSVLQPRSRGTVTLRSADPFDQPLIDPSYLAHPGDLEDLVQGMKTCQRIATSKSLRSVGARPLKTLIPGCERYELDENRYFRCQARSIFITLHHSVGTARMGDPLDQDSVVDSKLRVKKVRGLRVIDASVMPTIPSGNVNIPTIMIAEKASDMIKKTIQCFSKNEHQWDGPDKSTEWQDDDEEFKEHDLIDDEDEKQTEKPIYQEDIWIPEDEYSDTPEKPWKEAEKSKEEDKSLEDAYIPPSKVSWTKVEDDSEEAYLRNLQKPDSGKYYLKDYIKNSEKYQKESSPKKEKIPSDDIYTPPAEVIWTKVEDSSAEDYLHKLRKTDNGKYNLKDYVQSPEISPTTEETSSDKYSKDPWSKNKEKIAWSKGENAFVSDDYFPSYKKPDNEKYRLKDYGQSPVISSTTQGEAFSDKYSKKPWTKNKEKASWSKDEDTSVSDDYIRNLQKPDNNKYYLKDYIKDPVILATIKAEATSENHPEESMPYSWYKQQTDLLLKQKNQSTYSKSGDDISNKPWKGGPDSYAKDKRVEELVKLADIGSRHVR